MVAREAPDGAPMMTSFYVNNLDANVTDSQLYDLFSQIGDVLSVRLQLPLGHAFVNYANPQCVSRTHIPANLTAFASASIKYFRLHSAPNQPASCSTSERVLEELNFTPLNGKPIEITCYRKQPSMSNSGIRSLYIGNLDKKIDRKDLHEISSPFGNILLCEVAKDASGQSRGYGFVQFAGEESAEKAIAELNGMLLNGKEIYVGYFNKQKRELLGDEAYLTKVFVKNFCESTTEGDLVTIFGEFGLIESAVVMRDGNGTSRCFGFVNFANSKDAVRAVGSLNGQILNEKKLYVGIAKKKSERRRERKRHIEWVNEAFDKGSNLYVKNLDDNIDNEKLKELFSPFGSVTSCRLIRDNKGISTGRGFVAYSSPEEASRALSVMNGITLCKKPLYVVLALRTEDRRAGVQNLDTENHESFIDTYSSVGNPISCKVATFASGQLKGCGEESKDKATEEHNGMSLNVKQINKQEEELSAEDSNFKNVLVKNIGESTTEDELKALPETFLPFDNSSKEDRIAQLQNFEKEIDHKAPQGTFPSSCIVSTDASSQSMGYSHAQFGGVDSAQKAIGELNGIVRELSCLVGEFNGIIMGLNNILGGLNGVVMNKKQACAEPLVNKQVKKLFVYKANCTNVFVENLCDSTNEDDLKNIFGEFGLITSTVVMRNEDGTSKCSGFVNFENADDATKAVESLNGQKFDRNGRGSRRAQKRQHLAEEVDKGSNLYANNVCGNKKLAKLSPYGSVASCKVIRDIKGKKIRPGQRKRQHVKEAVDKASKLYINNLDASIGNKELMELFSPFGLVRHCKVLRNEKRISKGSALVAYSSPEEASRAISEMNGKFFSNKPLYVALSQKKEDAWAQLQNLDKELHCKAHAESFLSSQDYLSCKATDASDQSMSYDFVQFSGDEYAEKAIKDHDGLTLSKEQVHVESVRSNQEKGLPTENAIVTCVFVKNFCESTTEDELKNIFCEFGPITSTIVMRNVDGTSKCFGFVSFENAVDAARAVEFLNGKKFDNKKWYVRRAEKEFKRKLELKHCSEQRAKYPFNKAPNLSVNNLNVNSSNEKLSDVFSPFRPVKSCKVMQDRKGISKGSGLVAMSPRVDASRPNLDKELHCKAHAESFLSSQDYLSCKATDASDQSMSYDSVQFSGGEYAEKAIKDHDGLTLSKEQVHVESVRSNQEKGLPTENAIVTCVFVKNFCESTTEDKLKNIFCEFGPITSTIVMRNVDGTSKCFGYVSFENAVDAARAVESLNGKKFDNKKWYVRRAEKEFKRKLELKHCSEQRAKYPFNKAPNLSVNNLNDNSSNEKLSDVFSPFRPVKSCKVMQDRKRISKGSGLVAMSPRVDASRPHCEMNGKVLVGKIHCVAALAQRKEDKIVQLQPGFRYQELLVPGMRPARPLMPNMFVPLVKQQQHGSCIVGRGTSACPMEKRPQPAPAISNQMLSGGRGYCYPPGAGMFSVGGFPLRGAGMSQLIPVGTLASSFANASQLGRGRCLLKFCTHLLSNWSTRMPCVQTILFQSL